MSHARRFGVALWLLLAALPSVTADEPATATAEEPAAAAPAATPVAPAEPAADADAPGQEDLNAAIDAKLAIEQLDDFGRVLILCRQAIDKGLDEESRKFAEDLYTGTLIDRAGMLVEAIFESPRPDPQWPRIRAFAMRDLEEVVARDPKLGGVHLMIARLQTLPGGDRQRAAAAAAKALGLLGDDNLKRARATLVLADLEDDRNEKEALFDAAVELSPRDPEVRRARGMFHLVGDDFAKARDDLAVAAEEQPRNASLHEALGLALLMGEQLEEARAAFGRAIELEPDSIGPLLQRARVRALEGDSEEALDDIDRAVEIQPANRTALLLRARIQQQSGNSEAALADLETVLEQEPDLPAALELRGLLAAERHDYPAAILDFRRLAARNPDDTAVIGQLGMLYLAAKQPREAIKRFTRALEIDADNFPCRRGRSDAAISMGDHPAALADLEKAHALRPDDSGVLNNLAWLLATSPDDDLRNGKRALELATKACEETEWKEAHIISTLAAAYAETGDFDSARKFSRQAVEKGKDGDDEVAGQLAAELESYEAAKPWRERQEMAEAGAAGPAGKEPADDPAEPPAAAEPAPRRPFLDD
jgi:tetratricopeptide (TPR) repeat protein